MKNKRKFKLINPHLQKWFIFIIIIGLLISTVTSIAVSNFVIESTKNEVLLYGINKDSVLISFLTNQQYMLSISILVVGIVLIVVLSIYGYFLSHRIAGPIYSIQKSLEKYNGNEADLIFHLRKDDFFQYLPILIDTAINKKS